MNKKEILAEITAKELNEKEEINAECEIIDAMFEDLFDKTKKLKVKDNQWWKKIRKKYDIEENSLNLNRTTGEITRKEDVNAR